MAAARRLAPAVVLSCAVVLLAPYAGEVRNCLRAAFPGQYGAIINASVGLLIAIALLLAVARIRDRRPWRYGALAAALGLASLSAWWGSTDSASVNAVERFHFVEYGFITWLFYRGRGSLAERQPRPPGPELLILPALAALIVATADEAFQWFIPERVGEWRDVFLNGTAIAAGLLFSLGLTPPSSWRLGFTAAARRELAMAGTVLLVAMAGFLHLVHLGHLVRDDEIGSFRSRYAANDLLAASRDRADRWASDPPPAALVRLSREDQFLAEGVAHIRARNAAWETDVATAWAENLILEKYFGPVLDTASWATPLSRWPLEQRADAEARAPATQPAYVSDAEPRHILRWPPWALWIATAGLIAGLWAAVAAGRQAR